MLTVHHLNNSRSQRVLWMLEEIGIPYEIAFYQRTEVNLAPPELLAVHPLGKSPVITDGDLTIAESGAIVEYLARTYARDLIPEEGSPDFLRYTYWMHYAEGSAMIWMLMKLFMGLLGEAAKPLEPMVDARIADHLKFMEDDLGDDAFFVGDKLTGADFMMVFPLEAAAARGPLKDYPKLMDYVRRIHARPAYQRGVEKGGPYALMGGSE